MTSADQRHGLDAWLRLSLVAGLGHAALRKLLGEFGSPGAVLAAGPATLKRWVEADIAAAIAAGGNAAGAQTALQWLADPANHIVTLGDADYPRLLLEIPDPPPLLYVKGRRDLLNRPPLAIVGSGNATAEAIADAEDFAGSLGDAGVAAARGVAAGVDAAEGRGGEVEAASGAAVGGAGLDVVQPARNRELRHRPAARG